MNMNMFNRDIMAGSVTYPNLAIGMVVWAATGGCAIYQYCQWTSDDIYRRGVDKGYEKAKEELREQGKERMKISILDMTDPLVLWRLPTWSVKLLGDEYVVHIPLRKDYKTAWIASKDESDKLLHALKNILEIKHTETELEHMQSDARSNHYRVASLGSSELP